MLEIAAVSLAVVYKNVAVDETRGFLKATLSNYYASGNKTDAVTVMWNQLQAGLQCCGVDDYQDFANTAWIRETNKVIPESCCVLEDYLTLKPLSPTCMSSPSEANSYYKNVSLFLFQNINNI